MGVRPGMGLVTFALLMLAELALSVWLFGRSTAAFLASLHSPSGAAFRTRSPTWTRRRAAAGIDRDSVLNRYRPCLFAPIEPT
jgi:hypothetical protein